MSFHLYRINEIFSNPDGSIQFIELVGESDDQQFLTGHSITVTQASTTHTFTFPTDLASNLTSGKAVLLATQGFADLGLVNPDYILGDGFLFVDGGTVNFPGDGLANDTLVYASLPTDGINSLDGSGSQAINSPTNFAGASASLVLMTGTDAAETLNGTDGADFISGLGGNDSLNGGAGNDTLDGGAGNDRIDGGTGADVARYTGVYADYLLRGVLGGAYVFGADGNDTLAAVETLQFADATVQIGQLGGQAQDRVNTFVNNTQGAASVAVLADGGWVVTWQSSGQDGSLWGIYGQRFDATGLADGAEFRVNTRTFSHQSQPAVAALADGGWVVTWQSERQDGSVSGVYGQRYDAAGAADGLEFRVNTTYLHDQSQPDVTALEDGGWLVTWESYSRDRSGWDIYGQRYDATGALNGTEFRVNRPILNHQVESSVTGLADGGWVAIWSTYDGSDWDIRGRRFDASGVANGNGFNVNTYTASDQVGAEVAMLPDGGWLVVWQSNGQNGSGYGIYGKRYDASGTAVGSGFRANSRTEGDQFDASVAVLADGGWVVTWQSYVQETSKYAIFGRHYDANGVAAGPQFKVSADATLHHSGSSVTALPDGGWLIAWQAFEYYAQQGVGVFSQRYDAEGNPERLIKLQIQGDDSAQALAGGGGPDIILGAGGNDTLSGDGGNDTMDGGAGDDVMNGGDGFDVAVYANAEAGVVVNLTTKSASGGAGRDSLGNFEHVVGSGFDDVLYGSYAANRLEGGAGDDRLDGKHGADTMMGGEGDDCYIVDHWADMVIESSPGILGGIDTVISDYGFALPSRVENLRVLYYGSAIGNSLDNIIWSGPYGNYLDGSLGNDTVNYSYAAAGVKASLEDKLATGGSGYDNLIGFENIVGSRYDDRLTGNLLANRLEGGAGNDVLNGRGGADTMVGGSGSDLYYVGHVGDQVIETGASWAGGRDTVYASLSYSLGDNLENLRLLGSEAIDATGNALDNVLFAGTGDNRLDGSDGVDTASYAYATGAVTVSLAMQGVAQATGASGSDTLVAIEHLTGSAFDDLLTGDGGNNRIDGGLGLDTVSYADATAAVSAELWRNSATGGEGTDLLIAIENLVGSAHNDSLTGSAEANSLSGGAGNDELNGGGGADSLQGDGGNDTLAGGLGDDSLNGGDENDRLVGGDGRDQMTGGAGADLFDFNAAVETSATDLMWDSITDFSSGEGDKIDLWGIDADSDPTGNQAFASLDSGAAFSAIDTFTAARQLFFDTTGHILYGNTDADADAEFAIELVGVASLVMTDIVL